MDDILFQRDLHTDEIQRNVVPVWNDQGRLFGGLYAGNPRNAEGIAIVGDPRNDSHMLMAQMHLAMLKAHNAFVDEARATGAGEQAFETAVREMRWHYQRAILEGDGRR